MPTGLAGTDAHIVERLPYLRHRAGKVLSQFLARWSELHAAPMAGEMRTADFGFKYPHLRKFDSVGVDWIT